MKEGSRNTKLFQTDKPAVTNQVWKQGNRFEEEKLFKHIQNYCELAVWEKLFIQEHKLVDMNFDILPDKNLISKYEYIKPTFMELCQRPQKTLDKAIGTVEDEALKLVPIFCVKYHLYISYIIF